MTDRYSHWRTASFFRDGFTGEVDWMNEYLPVKKLLPISLRVLSPVGRGTEGALLMLEVSSVLLHFGFVHLPQIREVADFLRRK